MTKEHTILFISSISSDHHSYKTARDVLSGEGYKVLSSDTAEVLLRGTEQPPYSLIIIDLSEPADIIIPFRQEMITQFPLSIPILLILSNTSTFDLGIFPGYFVDFLKKTIFKR